MAEVLIGVVTAVIVMVLVWFVTPLKNRLEPTRMKMTGDHGIKLMVYGSPEEMADIDPKDLSGLEPFWLQDDGYYFAAGLPDENPPDSTRLWSAWAKRHGAEGASFRHVLLRIQATQDRTVLLLPPGLHVKRNKVTEGVVCRPQSTGGNGLQVRQFFVELDAEAVKYLGGRGGETAQFVMRKGDSEVFVVIAHAIAGRYQWYLDIRLEVDGKRIVLPATDNGRAFITVGAGGLTSRWWVFEQKRWLQPPW